jgi:hypothetical protein
MENSLHKKQSDCNIKRRCYKFRTCIYCAKLRQAKFADKAEALFSKSNALYLTRITPDISTKAELHRVKNAVKHQLTGKRTLWSIEIGEISHQLHLNLICEASSLPPIKNSSHHTTDKITDLRRVAAYMVKPSQIPPYDAYVGNLYGSWQSPLSILAQTKNMPIIQAAAIQHLNGFVENMQTRKSHSWQKEENRAKSQAEYKEKARLHLAGFMELLALKNGRDN